VLSDVAVTDGAQQSIGERMQSDIGVGVALEALGVRDGYAAQPDVVAGRKAVDVEPGADARFERDARLQQSLREVHVGGRRELHVVPPGGNEAHGQSGPFGKPRIVGEVVAALGGGAPVGVEDS